ncbi:MULTISPECIES: hypothetical protein [Nocardia]|uniref:Uncharacterized protein n=1 Tax=Nocardia nova TaxID=37330 RepID=A0A2T2ZE19_9NOCA|nr:MULTISPECIES: hypothetical protein [Nocardia]PSR66012.1 hypothetical protein C8259_01235 [Nocardia nova]
MASSVLAEHPASFDFDYSYWFDCECGQRVEVSAAAYEQQCQDEEPYPLCDCGRTIDISEAHPALRDLEDIDVQNGRVIEHFWYHSSPQQNWPSPTYREDLAAQLRQWEYPEDERESVIEAKASLALHLGTYAAAIENMLRRIHRQDSSACPYWLHQVQIRLRNADLAQAVHSELGDIVGDVRMSALADLGARAVRYVNAREAPGSISLAIDPQVILQVRTIPLSSTTAGLPATEAGRRAVARANADLDAAQVLRPDTSGIPEDQVFESDLDIFRAEVRGCAVSDEARRFTEQFAPQFAMYRDREREIWSNFKAALTETYLRGMTPQLRDRVRSVSSAEDPEQYHQRLRGWAGLIHRADAVVEQFKSASWRTPSHVAR